MRHDPEDPAAQKEGELDEMLTGFFHHEIPARIPPLPQREPTRMAVPFYRRISWDRMAAAAALTAIVLVALAQFVADPSPAKRESGDSLDAPSGEIVAANQPLHPGADDAIEDPLLTYFMVEAKQPIERVTYSTSQGNVEQVTEVQWSIMNMSDPLTGESIEVAIPKVSISIRPAVPGGASPEATATPY